MHLNKFFLFLLVLLNSLQLYAGTFSERFDQLLLQVIDDSTREKLTHSRDEILVALDAWCDRQSECQPELISVADIEGLASILLSAQRGSINLNIQLIRALAHVSDADRYQLLLSHQSELIRDFQRYCDLNIVCDREELTESQVAEYLKVRAPSRPLVSQADKSTKNRWQELPPVLPKPYWSCSGFHSHKDNYVRYGWLRWRNVRFFLDPDIARREQGPLIFYWHGSNENWKQVDRVLGESVIQKIVNEGGIVVVPHAGAPAATPWYVANPLTTTLKNDFYLADQLVSCAEQLYDIDERRIYSMGFGTGGVMSAAMGRFRSSYIASIVSHFGGQPPWLSLSFSEQPANYYSAFITYDKQHKGMSESLVNYLEWRGVHRVKVCQKDRGYRMPFNAMQKGWDWIKNTHFRRFYPSDIDHFQPADISYNGTDC